MTNQVNKKIPLDETKKIIVIDFNDGLSTTNEFHYLDFQLNGYSQSYFEHCVPTKLCEVCQTAAKYGYEIVVYFHIKTPWENMISDKLELYITDWCKIHLPNTKPKVVISSDVQKNINLTLKNKTSEFVKAYWFNHHHLCISNNTTLLVDWELRGGKSFPPAYFLNDTNLKSFISMLAK